MTEYEQTQILTELSPVALLMLECYPLKQTVERKQ